MKRYSRAEVARAINEINFDPEWRAVLRSRLVDRPPLTRAELHRQWFPQLTFEEFAQQLVSQEARLLRVLREND
jgi:hypothetical protein